MKNTKRFQRHIDKLEALATFEVEWNYLHPEATEEERKEAEEQEMEEIGL